MATPTHTQKFVVDPKVIMVEIEMLFHGTGHLRLRVPNTEIIRAVRNSCNAGMRVIAVTSGSETPNNVIVEMLRQYGIDAEHVALAHLAESRIKMALFYRYKPALVFEDNAELSAEFTAKGSWVTHSKSLTSN